LKTAIISLNEELILHLSYHLAPLSFEIQRFNDPSKLLDILKEDFDLIIFDVAHFPRHWKPFCKLLREEKSKEQTILILIKAQQFPFEEAAKAIYLGVNGIVEYNENDKQEIFRLTEIFKRYRSFKESRQFMRIVPDRSESFYILFTNPHTQKIVAGVVNDISIQGMMFQPLEPAMIDGLVRGDLIPRCSLQIGDNIISLECKVTRLGGSVGLEFTFFNDDSHHRLFTYLMDRPNRQLHTRVKTQDDSGAISLI
jgi:hypothetical protein